VVRAPGRVNLIGEHTDYNDGFVLPMAIDRWTYIALRPRPDDVVQIRSTDFDAEEGFSLHQLEPGAVKNWIIYPQGVAAALTEAGLGLQAWEGVSASDVPIGAGLSSSASVELAVARAFCCVSGFDWAAPRMARICQRAENHWAGVNSGIMDQLISACGIEGHAMLMDCADLSIKPVPLPGGVHVVVLDTGKRRGLVGSAYNERRAQCAAAASACGVRSLRYVTARDLESHASALDAVTFRRARHVISENHRTLQAAAAMESGDAVLLGTLMNESHASLRDDFEVSCAELDTMVGCAWLQQGCLGARMTGAGFGGCAIALVESAHVEKFITRVAIDYRAASGLEPSIYICRASPGSEVVWSG
jgi:galactokinase